MNDPVNKPKHYTNHPSGVECITITEHMGFNMGNAMKYIWRADLKNDDGGLQDIEKAIWYLKREKQRRILEEAKNSAMVRVSGVPYAVPQEVVRG